jgi:hypothetical protein
MKQPSVAFALRAVLKKEGADDVLLEIRRSSAFDFAILENGRPTGTAWKTVSPQQAMRGESSPFSLQEAWDSWVAKRFPDYTVTTLEEGFSGAEMSAP